VVAEARRARNPLVARRRRAACSARPRVTWIEVRGSIDLGGDVGTAQLVVVPGGDTPTCYGDGPGALVLLRRDGASFRQIYSNQGGFLALLTTRTRGVRDLAQAGPGLQHAVFVWNGSEYAPAGRDIADAELGGAEILP